LALGSRDRDGLPHDARPPGAPLARAAATRPARSVTKPPELVDTASVGVATDYEIDILFFRPESWARWAGRPCDDGGVGEGGRARSAHQPTWRQCPSAPSRRMRSPTRYSTRRPSGLADARRARVGVSQSNAGGGGCSHIASPPPSRYWARPAFGR